MSFKRIHRILIDSGATHCITPFGYALVDFKPQRIMLTLAAKGRHSVADGMGTLTVKFHSEGFESDWTLPNVIHDSEARSTLLATGVLQKIGIGVSFPPKTNLCILSDTTGRELCRGSKVSGGLYEMPISIIYPDLPEYSAKVLSAEVASDMHHALAHLRLGHVNEHDLATLVKSGKLRDINLGDLKQSLFCFGCKVGKATQLPYKSPPREKVTKPGGRVHIDIWGPARVSGLRGERYMLFLVDEATQFLKIYLMRSKDDAQVRIREYKAEMEKQHKAFELCILRSDNAREILQSNSMQQWMRAHGIVDEESPPHTPQLNGKSERAIRTVTEPTRSILAMANLPLTCWSEIVLAVAHIKNRLPSQAIGGRVPLEALTGKKASLLHLKILGCDAYALVKAPGRDKLQQKADRYILVGYGIDRGTYRLLHPNKRTVLVTRDVTFNEEGFVRKRYLPFRDHVGMEDRGDELIRPACELRDHSPIDSNLPKDRPHDDDDDDDTDYHTSLPAPAENGAPQVSQPIPKRVTTEHHHPETEVAPAPVARTPPPQQPLQSLEPPPKSHRHLHARRPARPPTPPSPTPLVSPDTPQDHPESPDPLTDSQYNPPRLPFGIPARGSVDLSAESPPPNLIGDEVDDPLLMAVTLETTDHIEVPQSYQEAISGPYAEYWQKAMLEEVEAHIQFGTWELVPPPNGPPVLTGKWTFAVKVLSPNTVRFRARWVARGFNQQHGIDYNETFAPVMNTKAWHILYALAAELGYKIRQYDVSNAFLHGRLVEQVYLEQPHGFGEGSNLVCRLVKSLYGLKHVKTLGAPSLFALSSMYPLFSQFTHTGRVHRPIATPSHSLYTTPPIPNISP